MTVKHSLIDGATMAAMMDHTGRYRNVRSAPICLRCGNDKQLAPGGESWNGLLCEACFIATNSYREIDEQLLARIELAASFLPPTEEL